MERFSERLRTLRAINNISQSALSKKLNITRATINAWEMGISYPNAQSLVLLSEYFCVTVDYLLGINGIETIDISKLNRYEQEMISEMVRYLVSIKGKK